MTFPPLPPKALQKRESRLEKRVSSLSLPTETKVHPPSFAWKFAAVKPFQQSGGSDGTTGRHNYGGGVVGRSGGDENLGVV
jgi:hypothetical protein